MVFLTDGRWNVSPVEKVPVGIRIIIHPWNSISLDLVSFRYACVCTGGGIYINALCAHANANPVPLVHPPPPFSLSHTTEYIGPEVTRFLECLSKANGDEAAAIKLYDGKGGKKVGRGFIKPRDEGKSKDDASIQESYFADIKDSQDGEREM